MEQKRFFYSKSSIYGWCVYDREVQMPAYNACAWLLPPVRQDEDGQVDESPVLLGSEYKAMRLCARLNVAYGKQVLTLGEVEAILITRGWNAEGREVILEDVANMEESKRTRTRIMRLIEDYEDR